MVRAQFEAFITGLGPLNPHGHVLVELCRELIATVENPPVTDKGAVTSIVPYVNSLTARLEELRTRGRSSDQGGDTAAGWEAIASAAGATPIRDTTQPEPGNVRPRGRRGSKTSP